MKVREVWKFSVPFPGFDTFSVAMPAGARVLTVQMQNGQPQLWALVEPDARTELRWFRIAGTGHPIDQAITAYVGTFQIPTLGLVFHLFEVPA